MPRPKPVTDRRSSGDVAAFTMVEIALALAIIGFALVAIIGALPLGLNVQKENREDTIITQEANYFIDAIRNGSRGLDEMTNNVISITNFWRNYDTSTDPWTPLAVPEPDGYTLTRSRVTSVLLKDNAFPLTNGFNIIGLLSRPKFEVVGTDRVRSNHMVALIRPIVGAASEKYPQTNASVLNLTFAYRMVAEVHTLRMPDANSNYGRRLQRNLHEVRLRFSWPVFSPTKIGKGRETFRALAAGEYQAQIAPTTNHLVFFFNPSTYQ